MKDGLPLWRATQKADEPAGGAVPGPEVVAGGAEEASELSGFTLIGDGVSIAGEIAELVSRNTLFAELDQADIQDLARYLTLYRAPQGSVLLREGDHGDHLLLVVQGKIDVYKTDRANRQKLISTVLPGMTIGEMAVIDGELRFATCLATEPCVFAVLSRDDLARIISERPRLGSRILVQLLAMMNQRLRQTSGILVDYLKVS